MTVTLLTRLSGGDRDKFIARAKKLKPIFEMLGAEVRVGQIFTGPHAGQWVGTARFADWESYGRAAQALGSDPAYRQMVAENFLDQTFKLEDRTFIDGIDL